MKIKIQSHYRLFSAAIVTAGIFALSFALIAWAGGPKHPGDTLSTTRDTIPAKEKRPESAKDFDKELRQLDEAGRQLEELKHKDWDKIRHDVEEAMKEIDLEKIRIQAEQAISKIDMEKIGREIEASLSKIDFDKIEQDIERAVDNISKIDKEKIRQEIKKARAEVDEQLNKKEWRKEMEEAKKINMKEIEQEMEKAKKEIAKVKDELKLEKLDMKETMAKAQAEVDNAKAELKGYQEMIYGMEKDGLLNTSRDYIVEYRKGELFINGKKQSSEVIDKYKKYFKKEPMTIKKENGDLEIDMD